jgi:hypothetical protein
MPLRNLHFKRDGMYYFFCGLLFFYSVTLLFMDLGNLREFNQGVVRVPTRAR